MKTVTLEEFLAMSREEFDKTAVEAHRKFEEEGTPPEYYAYISGISKEALLFIVLNCPEIISLFTMMYRNDAPIMLNKLYEITTDEDKAPIRKMLDDMEHMPYFKDLPQKPIPEYMQQAVDLMEKQSKTMKAEMGLDTSVSKPN